MNADAQMTRLKERSDKLRNLGSASRALEESLGTPCLLPWGFCVQNLAEPAHAPENRFSVDFTDAPSMLPGERDDMSVATGDDWA